MGTRSPGNSAWQAWPEPASPRSVHVDCSTCLVRDVACGDCVITALLQPDSLRVEPFMAALEPDEQAALHVLADAGVLPPLRLLAPAADEVIGEPPPLSSQADYAWQVEQWWAEVDSLAAMGDEPEWPDDEIPERDDPSLPW